MGAGFEALSSVSGGGEDMVGETSDGSNWTDAFGKCRDCGIAADQTLNSRSAADLCAYISIRYHSLNAQRYLQYSNIWDIGLNNLWTPLCSDSAR